MKNKFYCLSILSVILCSCVYNHTDNIDVLGQGYYFLGDGNESQILFDDSKVPNYKSGITIISQEVTDYDYDNNYIIAKSEESEKGIKSFKYWIVDKRRKQDIITTVDSISFFRKIDSLHLKVKLKVRK